VQQVRLDSQDLVVLRDHLVLDGTTDKQGPRVSRALLEALVFLETMVSPVNQVIKEPQVQQDQLDLLVNLVQQVPLE